jgi:hypothetical protein
MFCMLISSAVDRGFKPWSGQTKGFKVDICCWKGPRNWCVLYTSAHYIQLIMVKMEVVSCPENPTNWMDLTNIIRSNTSLKKEDWLARNQNNVSELSNMSIRRLLFQ